MTLDEYELLQPHAEIDGIKFFTPNKQVAWRVQTLHTKEPDTIAWLSAMRPGATFFDVGANIGQYTLFAAKHGLTVQAFEPESQNFALLCRNLVLNDAQKARAWPFALGATLEIAPLHVSSILAGGSCHAFSQSLDFRGNPKQFAFEQGSISVPMDTFAAQFGYPDHIKIDVDGFEHRVCAGAHKCLLMAESVLVEINTHYPEHMALVDKLQTDYGFKVDPDQIHAARRTTGAFIGIGNYIFFKGDTWK